MTDRILKIKVEVDTKALDEISKGLLKQEQKSQKLVDIETKLAFARAEAALSIQKANTQLERYNKLQQEGNRAQNLYKGFYKKQLEEVNSLIDSVNKLKQLQSITTFREGLTTPKGKADLSFYEKQLKENAKRELEIIKTIATEKKLTDEFYAKDKLNLYTKLFSEIEAKEKTQTESIKLYQKSVTDALKKEVSERQALLKDLANIESRQHNERLAQLKETLKYSPSTAASNAYLGGRPNVGESQLRPTPSVAPNTQFSVISGATKVSNLKEIERLQNLFKNTNFAQTSEASRQLIAGMSAAGKQAALANQAITTSIKESTKAVNEFGETHKRIYRNLFSQVSLATLAYKVFNTTLQLGKQAFSNVFESGISQRATQSALSGIFGSAETINNLKFIRQEADKAGAALESIEEGYRKFAPSAALAGVEQAKINDIFSKFTEIGTVLHLTRDQMQSLFLALEQMAGKGTVNAEELKRQLGNVLPGAVELAAKSMNLTVADFMKAMKNNQVIFKDFIDNFANSTYSAFGGSGAVANAREQLQGQLNLLGSAYTDLNRTIFAKVEPSTIKLIQLLTNFTSNLQGNIGGILSTLSTLASALVTGGVIYGVSNLLGKLNSIAAVQKLLISNSYLLGSAVVAGSTVAIASLAGLNLVYSEQQGLIIKLKTQSVDFFRVLGREALITLSQIGAAFVAAYKTAKEFFTLNPYKKTDKKFADFYQESLTEALNKLNSTGNAITDVLNEHLSQVTEQFANKSALTVQAAIEQGVLKTNEEITAALAKVKDFEGVPPSQEANETAESAKLKAKEESFTKERQFREYQQKALDLQYQKEKAIIDLKKSMLDLEVSQRESTDNPIGELEIIRREFDLKKQQLELELKNEQDKLRISKLYRDNVNQTTAASGTTLTNILNAIHRQESSSGKNPLTNVVHQEKGGPVVGDYQIQKATFDAYKKSGEVWTNAADQAKVAARIIEEASIKYKGDVAKIAVRYFGGTGTVQAGEAYQAKYGGDFLSALRASGNPKSAKYGIDILNKLKLNKGDIANAEAGNDYQTQAIKVSELYSQLKLVDAQKQAELNKQFKLNAESTKQIEIESLRSRGLELEAEKKQILLQLEKDIYEAKQNSNDNIIPRLQALAQEQVAQTNIKFTLKNIAELDEKHTKDVEELSNKRLLLSTSTQQSTQQLVALETEYIDKKYEQLKQLEKEAELINNIEKRKEIAKTKEDFIKQLRQNEGILFQSSNDPLAQGLAQFNSTNVSLDSQYAQSQKATNIEIEQAILDGKYEREVELKQRLLDLETAYQIQKQNIEFAYAQTNLQQAEQHFSALTTFSQQFFGEQSKAARIAFAFQKSLAASQAVITGIQAVQSAYAAGWEAGGPYAGPVLSVAYAGLAAAATVARVATILSQPLPSGAAHGGLTNVPEETTYLLQKGERVLSPKQNVDITNKVTNIHERVTNNKSEAPAIRIINVTDANHVYDALGTDQAEKLVMNIVNRNR